MTIYDQPTLRDIVHEVVQTLKRNLKVDGKSPSREEILAGIPSAVRMVLRSKGIKEADLEPSVFWISHGPSQGSEQCTIDADLLF